MENKKKKKPEGVGLKRMVTPEIDRMEKVLEQGRKAFRTHKPIYPGNPYPYGTRQWGWWRLGWYQERDNHGGNEPAAA